ncbi:MAG: spore coat protein [Syntrophomonadaceae bacterium]|nr:spore coat protein [Syntrophomonadaceae bacterium]MDD3890127.1 spore coat protein [Syntrophomonadaceae bacterium]MDD4549063.1 spore coat protein [Syntrophomonadaceae bacterium]
MALNFTQKERMLLEDQKAHEQVCVDKYTTYTNQAQDQQLKSLFQGYAAQEQQHLNSINQMLNGQLPPTGQGQQQQSQQQTPPQPSSAPGGMVNQNDATLCNDMLMTEKYVSAAYNTSIFEFRDTNVRQVLNHIQKEEQQHGEGIFHYMQNNGMYNPQ